MPSKSKRRRAAASKDNAPALLPGSHRRRDPASPHPRTDRYPREGEHPVDYYLRLCRSRLLPPALPQDLLNSERAGGRIDPLALGLRHEDVVRRICFLHSRALRARQAGR